jgi:hypothetical protein
LFKIIFGKFIFRRRDYRFGFGNGSRFNRRWFDGFDMGRFGDGGLGFLGRRFGWFFWFDRFDGPRKLVRKFTNILRHVILLLNRLRCLLRSRGSGKHACPALLHTIRNNA